VIYKELGYRKKLLTEQDLVDRTAGRKWRNDTWTAAYRLHRRTNAIWMGVFLLLFSLLGAVLFGTLMIAKYGK